jgi:5-methyltetrahydropteroyltriglutamate--homocysteine methyltransferase
MRASTDQILTTHVGSLPRPDALIEANRRREVAEAVDESGFQAQLRPAVANVVRHQKELGIATPNDGEFGKAMGQRVNYGAWLSYSFHRLGGLDLAGGPDMHMAPPRRSQPGQLVLTSFGDRRDRVRFAAAYADPESGITTGPRPATGPVCVAPLSYIGRDAIRADIANFTAALAANGIDEGFMTAIAPGSTTRIGNAYYRTYEEFVFAAAEAMREEYKAILDAGLVLQLDDPALATNWDMITPEPSLADYRKFAMVQVEALNHALRGLPKERIRFHLCWGSWHGPHTTDIPMRDIVEVMLKVDAGGIPSRPAMSATSTNGRSGKM